MNLKSNDRFLHHENPTEIDGALLPWSAPKLRLLSSKATCGKSSHIVAEFDSSYKHGNPTAS